VRGAPAGVARGEAIGPAPARDKPIGVKPVVSKPISRREFERAMAALGPFERAPHLALAVSGGSDSMALALLASDWARSRSGKATALIVDHGLRAGSDAEARKVRGWLRARAIPAHSLTWQGPKPRANIQAAARAARYALLSGWCAKHGVRHLLLAHQQEDQAETLLLRLARGSGLDGLAAMAPVSLSGEVRLLRPLLHFPRARLVATLQAEGQGWIEDPSNRDPRHARARLRALLPALAQEGLTTERLAATAARLARARQALESAVEALLARAATLDPAGYATLDRVALASAPAEIALRALAALLQTLGGGDYTPRLARLERLYREIGQGLPAARTLGGCRILRLRLSDPTRLLICREPAALALPAAVTPGKPAFWDGRFRLLLVRRPAAARGALRLGALGAEGWRSVKMAQPALADSPIPAPARPSLPALFDLDGPLLVPHLCYGRGSHGPDSVAACRMEFRPSRPLAFGSAAPAR
jgi:tRNA(Ile)-lysidine synthase